MRPKLALALAGGLLGLVAAVPVSASPSRCVDCHTAIAGPPRVASHFADWQQSAHARHGVGCERCHGGDPTMAEPQWAHRGILHSSRPNSPVNGGNLFRTCAPCHAAQAGAFATSLHRVLLDADDLRAPTCSTCHGSMTARVPSPETLEARCAECHRAGSTRGAYPARAREGLEAIARMRVALGELSSEVTAVGDANRRRELRARWDAASRATADAVTAFHAFDLRRMDAALDAAQREADGVAGGLAR